MSQPITAQFTIVADPLPTNFSETPQELFEAMLDRLEITTTALTFSVGDTEPAGNEGPWLKNGTKWYVWDDVTVGYIPLDISDSLDPDIVIVSEDDLEDVDVEKTQVAAILASDSESVAHLKFYLGATLGWVEMDRELTTGSVITEFLAENAVTRTKIKNGEVTAEKLASDIPVTKLAAGSPTNFLRTTAEGTVAWGRYLTTSPLLTLTANSTLTHNHGLDSVPNYVDAVLVCKSADREWEVDDEFSITGHGNVNGIVVFRNDTEVGLQIPDNIQVREKDDPDGTAANLDFSKWDVKFIYGLG